MPRPGQPLPSVPRGFLPEVLTDHRRPRQAVRPGVFLLVVVPVLVPVRLLSSLPGPMK